MPGGDDQVGRPAANEGQHVRRAHAQGDRLRAGEAHLSVAADQRGVVHRVIGGGGRAGGRPKVDASTAAVVGGAVGAPATTTVRGRKHKNEILRGGRGS